MNVILEIGGQTMEFHEKLQQLRKKKGLTQEQLAAQLYVSRTAISKWESGRGYPNLESLKSISKLFSISIDELLPTSERYGHHHLSILGVIAGMALMALSLIIIG